MRLDITEYNRFYDSGLGHLTRRTLRRRLRAMWPDVRGARILGLGYATPYLAPFRHEAERVIAIMPAAQGVMPWPRSGHNLAALAEETHLPLPDASMDRVILIHALETSEALRKLLREVWRVLTPAGRMLVVVTNRASPWAWLETTPFGHGSPFTQSQLERVLRDATFMPEQWGHALCYLPLHWPIALKYGQALESGGQKMWRRFSGVVMVDTVKEAYAALPMATERAVLSMPAARTARPAMATLDRRSMGEAGAPRRKHEDSACSE